MNGVWCKGRTAGLGPVGLGSTPGTPTEVTQIMSEEIAWAAGLFEGEGCIHMRRDGDVQVSIKMTDRDVIERFANLFPVPKIYVRPAGARTKETYEWRTTRARLVEEMIRALRPYLLQRRGATADVALARLAKIGLPTGVKPTCPAGHAYSGRDKAGQRICHECKRVSAKRRRDAKHALARGPGQPPSKR